MSDEKYISSFEVVGETRAVTRIIPKHTVYEINVRDWKRIRMHLDEVPDWNFNKDLSLLFFGIFISTLLSALVLQDKAPFEQKMVYWGCVAFSLVTSLIFALNAVKERHNLKKGLHNLAKDMDSIVHEIEEGI